MKCSGRLLGLSLAGYNVLISLLMAAIRGLGFLRGPRAAKPLIVDIFLRPSEQMDDAGGRDSDEHEPRQMMRTDEDRVDVQRQRQRQHGVHCARRERDHDVAEI